MARDALNDTGQFQVIGGVLSLASDEYGKPGLISGAHRLAMCRRAVQDSDWISADDWEVLQPAHTPSLLVLQSIEERIHRRLGTTAIRIILLAGSDLVKSFGVPGLWALQDVLHV